MYMIDIGVVHLLYKEKLSSPMSTNKWKDQNDDYYNNDEKGKNDNIVIIYREG